MKTSQNGRPGENEWKSQAMEEGCRGERGEKGRKYKTQGVEMRRQAIKEGTNRSGPAKNSNETLIWKI